MADEEVANIPPSQDPSSPALPLPLPSDLTILPLSSTGFPLPPLSASDHPLPPFSSSGLSILHPLSSSGLPILPLSSSGLLLPPISFSDLPLPPQFGLPVFGLPPPPSSSGLPPLPPSSPLPPPPSAPTAPSFGVSIKDFRAVAKLGRGSFGCVFAVRPRPRVQDLLGNSGGLMRNGGVLALKKIKKRSAGRTSWRRGAVRRESQVLALMRGCKCCLQLVSAFQSATNLYFLTEYYSGGSLDAYLQKHRKINRVASFIYLAAELVSAVSFIHGKGVIHRDLKPENIMLTAQGHVVIVDFGLAFNTDDAEEAVLHVGTPLFRAPESFLNGMPLNEAADWWSLGVTLLETVSGKNPFMNLEEMEHESIKAEVERPGFIPPTLPDKFRSFFKGLFTINRHDRLGARGGEEVKRHRIFHSRLPTPAHWRKLADHQLPPPVLPSSLSHRLQEVPGLCIESQSEEPAEAVFPGFDVLPPALFKEEDDNEEEREE